jgi:glycosyltransferase involved in cell wall biosynthesis
MNKAVIVYLFNSPLESGCDYVDQTMKIVAKKNRVFGLALGNIVSIFQVIAKRNFWLFRKLNQYHVLRPVSFLPGIRLNWVRIIAYTFWCLWLRLSLDLRYPRSKKILWYFEPFHIPSLLWIFTGYTLVYDCVDYYPSFNKQAQQQHVKLMSRSNYVFANSKNLAGQLKKVRPDIFTVPLGFATELFKNIKVLQTTKNKKLFIVGYIGSISDRLDFSLLETVVSKLPTIQFTFIGPIERDVFGKKDTALAQMESLTRYQNVRWIKGVAKKKIPSIISTFDIGIIPYRSNLAFNQFSFPMKTLEYFAAGKPVISTGIRELRQFQKQGLVSIENTSDEFIKSIKYLQKNGWAKDKQKLQHTIALNHSWQKKVDAIWKVIN